MTASVIGLSPLRSPPLLSHFLGLVVVETVPIPSLPFPCFILSPFVNAPVGEVPSANSASLTRPLRPLLIVLTLHCFRVVVLTPYN